MNGVSSNKSSLLLGTLDPQLVILSFFHLETILAIKKCATCKYVQLRRHPHITSYSSRFIVLGESLIFYRIELNTKNSTKRQHSYRLVEVLVFNSAFGRH